MKHTVILSYFLLVGFQLFSQQQDFKEAIYHVQDSVLIPTNSGIPISAIIVRVNANVKPLPAVLFYTTYLQSGDSVIGKVSADKGYVGVVAYARGIRTDLSNYAPYEHEATDIYDIIDWISKQSWCNGQVAMFGGSYTGFSQWSTAKNLHPALTTIVPQVSVMPGFDVPMENNVQLNMGLYWPNDNIYKREPIRRSLPFEWFEKGISFRKLDSLAGQSNLIFQKWLQHPSYDSYWQSMVPTAVEYTRINIPVLTTTGYYDGAQISALRYFILHNKYNKNANHFLVIGPYDHWGGQRKAASILMGYEIDSVAIINMQDLVFQWFDYIMKNGIKPELLKDKVNYQVMGTNTWKHAPILNRINNDTLTLYLTTLKESTMNLLSEKKERKKSYLNQSVNFKDRESQNNYFTPTIIFNSLDASNGIIYATKPFENDFEINGSFIGNLSASINKEDLDISMALYELMPNGKYFFLTRYLGRASYAKDNSTRGLLKPNKDQNIPIRNTRFISKRVNKGSRLVVLLNINKHPFEIINYGSGKEVIDETIKDAGEPLQIKWYNDSYIRIPCYRKLPRS